MPLRLPFRLSCRREFLAALLVVQACGVPSGPQAPERSSVVQLLLRADQVEHAASIRDPRSLESVHAEGVALELRGPDGIASLDRSGAGAWGVEIPVSTGGAYQLHGLVGGVMIDWRVVMPGALLLRAPRNGDTVHVSADPFAYSFALPFSPEASGVAGYAVEQVTTNGDVVHVEWLGTGVDTITAYRTAERIHRFRIYALEANAWRFLRGQGEPRELTGVRGFLGGAVVDSVDVVVVR